MLRMEVDSSPEAPSRPPQMTSNTGCDRELTRSSSDASSLTAENRKAVVRSSSSVSPDNDGNAWTNEKHNLYLHNLEVSFVEHLHHSKALPAPCSELIQGDMNNSQKQSAVMKKTSEQFIILQKRCRRKSKYTMAEGMGQNYSDEGNLTSNSAPRAKKLKTAAAESSLQGQIVPSTKCPTGPGGDE